MIRVEPLASGYSKDVHGQITVTQDLSSHRYLFHALDSGVTCVLLGSG